MPTKVGIHDFPFGGSQSRGWRAFARHDAKGRIDESSVWRAGIIVPPRARLFPLGAATRKEQ
jgi:hypothetical protein